jgi:hypothetical protein
MTGSRRGRRCDIGCCALALGWATTQRWYLAKMMKGDNVTQQSPRHTQPDDRRQVQHHSLFRAADPQAEDRHPATRSITLSAAAHPSGDVFSHASEYDVAEQQRPATQHDEVAMRSLRLPFETEADILDAIDQRRSVSIDEDEDDYR